VTDVRPAGIPFDTAPEILRLEIEALRKLTPEQRSQLWVDFQASIESMEREALHRAHPNLDQEETVAMLIKRRHGADLAALVFPNIDLTGLR
jgi:hypothetical protein